MNDKDKQEFEKWLYENKSSLVIHGGLKKMDDDFHLCWKTACDYMRNRSPLDPVSLYDKLEQERDRSEVLVEALEKLSLYVSHNGDTWVKERATEALKKYRGEA
jgi:hypothetical protein